MKKYGARVQEKFKTALSKKRVWTLLVLVVVLAGMIFYHTSYKALPEGLSYEGDVHELEDIEFIYNLTYPDPEGESVQELRIFDEVNDMISKAEEFVVIDMFFFNSYTDGIEGLPELSGNLADALIAQKKKHPDLKVVFITDRVNTVYDSYQPKEIERLRNHDIDVVMTSLEELRDSNPLYSSVWRLFFQWFGQEGNGWIPNPMASDAPEVTFRSYMDMMNIKANHRKTVVTEKEAMVSSANPHDMSGHNENIAFKVKGPILKDILEAEKAVVDYSAEEEVDFPNSDDYTFDEQQGNLKTQYLTEGKIYRALLEDINRIEKNDTVWLGMFYLADRKILNGLKDAAERGAAINIVMDPNKTAFGNQKTGLPNLPVAAELQNLENEQITIRWYNVDEEQYHTKMIYIDKPDDEDVIIGGSANFTYRNMANLNLEADLRIQGPEEEQVMQDVGDYFDRIWNNEDATYTVAYEDNESDLNFLLSLTYRLQKLIWFTTY